MEETTTVDLDLMGIADDGHGISVEFDDDLNSTESVPWGDFVFEPTPSPPCCPLGCHKPWGDRKTLFISDGKHSPKNVDEEEGSTGDNKENNDDFFLKLGSLVSMLVTCFNTASAMSDAFQDRDTYRIGIINAVIFATLQVPVLLVLIYAFLKDWIKAKFAACLSCIRCRDTLPHHEGSNKDPEHQDDSLDPNYQDDVIYHDFQDDIQHPECQYGTLINFESHDAIKNPEYQSYSHTIYSELRNDTTEPKIQRDINYPEIQEGNPESKVHREQTKLSNEGDSKNQEIQDHDSQSESKSQLNHDKNGDEKQPIHDSTTSAGQPLNIAVPSTHASITKTNSKSGHHTTYEANGSEPKGTHLDSRSRYNKRRNQQSKTGKKYQKPAPKNTPRKQSPSHFVNLGDRFFQTGGSGWFRGFRGNRHERQHQANRGFWGPEGQASWSHPEPGWLEASGIQMESHERRRSGGSRGFRFPWKFNKQKGKKDMQAPVGSLYYEPLEDDQEGERWLHFRSQQRTETPSTSSRNRGYQSASSHDLHDVTYDPPKHERKRKRRPQRHTRRLPGDNREITPLQQHGIQRTRDSYQSTNDRLTDQAEITPRQKDNDSNKES